MRSKRPRPCLFIITMKIQQINTVHATETQQYLIRHRTYLLSGQV